MTDVSFTLADTQKDGNSLQLFDSVNVRERKIHYKSEKTRLIKIWSDVLYIFIADIESYFSYHGIESKKLFICSFIIYDIIIWYM